LEHYLLFGECFGWTHWRFPNRR